MEATVELASGNSVKQVKTMEFPPDVDESTFWRAVSENRLDAPIPGKMTVGFGDGRAILDIQERGTYLFNGCEHPSMLVAPVANTIELPQGTYNEAYLTCITAESKGGRGSSKFYRFRPTGKGIEAEYGRIGESWGFGSPRKVAVPYPTWMYWPILFEKLSKGYVDQTEVYLAQTDGRDEESEGSEVGRAPLATELYSRLLSMAKTDSTPMAKSIYGEAAVNTCSSSPDSSWPSKPLPLLSGARGLPRNAGPRRSRTPPAPGMGRGSYPGKSLCIQTSDSCCE